MAREDNLKPVRTHEEAQKRGSAGGIKSGIARRKRADFRKAAEELLLLEIPASSVKKNLQLLGIDPTMENALLFSSIFEAIRAGDINVVMKLREITGQVNPIEKKESAAKLKKLEAETENVRAEIARKTGTSDTHASDQIVAIADLINTPAPERKLSEVMQEAANDTICTADDATD